MTTTTWLGHPCHQASRPSSPLAGLRACPRRKDPLLILVDQTYAPKTNLHGPLHAPWRIPLFFLFRLLLIARAACALGRLTRGSCSRSCSAGRGLAHALAGLLGLLAGLARLDGRGGLGLQIGQQRRTMLRRARLQLAQPAARPSPASAPCRTLAWCAARWNSMRAPQPARDAGTSVFGKRCSAEQELWHHAVVPCLGLLLQPKTGEQV